MVKVLVKAVKMPSNNEKWRDALIQRHILVLMGMVSVHILLNDTEPIIASLIRESLRIAPEQLTKRLSAANSLIREIRSIRFKMWDEIDRLWLKSMEDLVVQEAKFLKSTLRGFAPKVGIPKVSLLRGLVETTSFQGRTLSEWGMDIRTNDWMRISDQIRIGVVQGESSSAIAQGVVGTAKLKGTDGVTQITRRHAETISRTATTHFMGVSQNKIVLLNEDLFDNELFVAVLDGVTTKECRRFNGQHFPLGVGPQPPINWNCRSRRIPVMVGGGVMPNPSNLDDWMHSQPISFQNKVLGIKQAKLFRQGNVVLDKLVV